MARVVDDSSGKYGVGPVGTLLSMKDVVAVIMGGGQGARLFPLTRDRAKPAVPVAGRIRLIDIPLSNCINSGITQMYVLTQFNSESLNRHVTDTYQFGTLTDSRVQVLAAEQTTTSRDWFQGTADAVRRSLRHFLKARTRLVIVLAGDHLYRMNYAAFVKRHEESQADITIAACPQAEETASNFGLMHVTEEGVITRFAEKPSKEELGGMQIDPEQSIGGQQANQPFLASMGIYVFSPEVLVDLLEQQDGDHDFGKQIIPKALDRYRCVAHFFHGYWEDIGTIQSFYDANLRLARSDQFSLYDPDYPLFTRPRYLSPTHISEGNISTSLIAEGSKIGPAEIRDSVVGIRSVIQAGCVLDGALVMGNDVYETETEQAAAHLRGLPPLGIGEGTVIRRAIIDKNTRIGAKVTIVNEKSVQEEDGEQHYIRDGIVIVPKNAVIPDGTVI